MTDACGRAGLTSLSVNPRQQVAQRQSDDLSAAQTGERFESSQNFQIGTIKPNRCDLADFLHHTTLDASEHVAGPTACDSNTNDIHDQPQSSGSVTLGCDDELSGLVAVASGPLEPKALPPADLDWLLNPEKAQTFTDRILAHRLLAEAKGEDYDEKLAHRLAWHIVSIAASGEAVECSAVTLAYYRVVGCHEDQFFSRRMNARQALLGHPKFFPRHTTQSESEWALADTREGDVPQKTCAYGAEEAKLAGQKRSDLTGASRSTAIKREARRSVTSELGPQKAAPAGLPTPAENLSSARVVEHAEPAGAEPHKRVAHSAPAPSKKEGIA